jgi:hypothetical protein
MSKITLVGGPGDGETFEWGEGDDLKWVPKLDRERIIVRTLGRPLSEADPIRYRRSLRTRHLFVYQP